MPKSKKRKTGHHVTNQNGELSHAEIWDDSALIRSWNDAYAEYEFYHSIHANGEDVEEILRQAEAEDENIKTDTKSQASEAEEGEINDDDNKDDDSDYDDKPETNRSTPAAVLNGSDSVTVTEEEQHRLVTPKVHPTKAQIGPQVFPTTTTHNEPTLQDRPPTADLDRTEVDTEGRSASADQTLENLKMAYYWAGYYSGLYDGQKQATIQSQPQGSEQKQNIT